jgi:hypothetical protein
MEYRLLLAGLGLSLGGAVVVALADAWLSRMVLTYLDAVEADLERLVEAVRAGGTRVTVTGIDVKRDRRQDRVRTLKTVGWLLLALGFGLQLAATYANPPRP